MFKTDPVLEGPVATAGVSVHTWFFSVKIPTRESIEKLPLFVGRQGGREDCQDSSLVIGWVPRNPIREN